MIGKKIRAFIEIARAKNCLLAGIFAIVGFWVYNGIDLSRIPQIIVVFLAVVIITASGNMMNDFSDRDVDALHDRHRKRPIPSGRLSPKEVKQIAIVCFFIGVLLAYFIEPWCGLIAFINVCFLVAYDMYLKNKGFPGNIVISYLVGSAVLFGNVAAVGEIVFTINLFIFFSLAFLTNLAREVVKDVEDAEGDRIKRETLPMKIGEGKAMAVALSFLVIAVVLSPLPLPLICDTLGWGYLVVFGADLIFIALIRSAILELKDAHTIQKWIKGGMAVALLAFVLGVVTL